MDLAGVLAPLRRGRGDPTWRLVGDGGAVWRACTTADGAATMRLHRRGDGTVVAAAWGPGTACVLDGLPALLGADDDPDTFVAHHPLITDAARRLPGVRFGSTGRVWDVLVAAVLEQKVTGVEARRSWRELCWRFGDPAPGPAPEGMRVPPTPTQIRAVPDWEWHRAGVDSARRRAILACAAVAHRLENACTLGGDAGRELLRRVPGIGTTSSPRASTHASASRLGATPFSRESATTSSSTARFFAKFSPWKRGDVRRQSSGAKSSTERIVPDRNPRPSGE